MVITLSRLGNDACTRILSPKTRVFEGLPPSVRGERRRTVSAGGIDSGCSGRDAEGRMVEGWQILSRLIALERSIPQ